MRSYERANLLDLSVKIEYCDDAHAQDYEGDDAGGISETEEGATHRSLGSLSTAISVIATECGAGRHGTGHERPKTRKDIAEHEEEIVV